MTNDARRLVRNAANIVNLSTPLGLAVALATRARLRRAHGLIFAEKARLGFLPAGAITVGSVVLVPRFTLDELRSRTPGIVAHEDAHAWQYAYCLGLPFIPLYFVATLWSWLRLGDRASGNFFECQAGLELGGYRAGPPQRRSREADRSA